MNSTIMWKEIFEQADAIPNVIQQNRRTVAALAGKVKEAGVSQIVFVARGTSDHAATFGKYLLEISTGIPVGLSAASVCTIYGSQLCYQGALVIGVSQSGAGVDVCEVLKSAKKGGAITAAITNDDSSIIAKAADYHLHCACGEEISVAATKTFVSQLLLVTMLAAALSGKPELEAVLPEIEKASRYVLSLSQQVEQLALRYRFMSECFVLSRGLGYPIALETGLKIQETCYVKAKAYSVADFKHGPFAMVDSNTPVYLIGVDRRVNGDIAATLDRLNEVGADSLVVTNDKGIYEKATVGVLLPEWCDGITGCFAAAAIAQMFASTLSLLKGNNPDAPRGLKKVTITR